MRLISCHIENFGGLSGVDLSFSGDITTFCEANGYGKTTIAAFLKAMFYGMDSSRANSSFNDRRHYAPFGGGNYGGYVVFSCGGKKYKIERYFDEKSEGKDRLSAYCNDRPFPAAETLGEDLFGVDRESFERTAFISSGEIEIASTGSINAKLHSVLEGGEEADMDAAIGRLERKSKLYKKSRQGDDLITRETRRIGTLTERIVNLEKIASGLAEKNLRLESAAAREKEIEKEVAVAQKRNYVLKDWEHFDRIAAEAERLRGEVRAIEARYLGGFPEREETARMEEALRRDIALRARAGKTSFTPRDGERLSALQLEFASGVPDERALAAAEEEIRTLSSIAAEREREEREEPGARERASAELFGKVSREETDRIENKLSEWKTADARCSALPDTVAIAPSQKKSRKTGLRIALVLSVLLLLGGGASLFFSTVAGAILLALGIVGLLAVGFLYLNGKTGGSFVENPEKQAAKAQRDGAIAELTRLLAPYGVSFEHGPAFAVASFREEVARYAERRAGEAARERKLAQLKEREAAAQAASEAFFARYSVTEGSPERRLARLRADADSYRELCARLASSEEEEEEIRGEIARNAEPVAEFCRRNGRSGEDLAADVAAIAHDLDEYSKLLKDIADYEARAEAFRKEKSLGERPEGEPADLDALTAELSAAQEVRRKLFEEITDDEREIEQLGDLRNERDAATEQLASYKKTYELLQGAIENIRRADERLKEKYIRPIKDKFVYYSKLLERALGEKVTVGSDFEVRFVQNGQERNEKHLSAGQRCICALCFRLALIDGMYVEEKPFLIFDDPFVHLDAEHLKQVRILLEELSSGMQIVYFCCHESRKL